MNKGDFSTLHEYETALRDRQYAGQEPVDPKIASSCLEDAVKALGDSTNTTGACPLAPECNYNNDKVSGISGFCLKQAVGVEIK